MVCLLREAGLSWPLADMNRFSLALLLLTCLLDLCLAILLVRREVLRVFRFFFLYTVFAIAAEVLKFALLPRSRSWAFFYVAWGAEAIYVILGFAAIYEVFRLVFKGFESHRWFKFLLPTAGVLLVGPSIWWTATTVIPDSHPLLVAVLSAEIVVRCLQIGFFLVIFGLAAFFDMQWRRYEFGIAAGFFVSAVGLLLSIIVRSETGTKHAMLLNYGPPVSYILAVLIWLASFWRPPRDPFEGMDHLFTPELFMQRLEWYEKKAKEFFKPWLSRISSSFTSRLL